MSDERVPQVGDTLVVEEQDDPMEATEYDIEEVRDYNHEKESWAVTAEGEDYYAKWNEDEGEWYGTPVGG